MGPGAGQLTRSSHSLGAAGMLRQAAHHMCPLLAMVLPPEKRAMQQAQPLPYLKSQGTLLLHGFIRDWRPSLLLVARVPAGQGTWRRLTTLRTVPASLQLAEKHDLCCCRLALWHIHVQACGQTHMSW